MSLGKQTVHPMIIHSTPSPICLHCGGTSIETVETYSWDDWQANIRDAEWQCAQCKQPLSHQRLAEWQLEQTVNRGNITIFTDGGKVEMDVANQPRDKWTGRGWGKTNE